MRGPFPDWATSQSRAHAGVRRPFALCMVRVMLLRIASDPIHRCLLATLLPPARDHRAHPRSAALGVPVMVLGSALAAVAARRAAGAGPALDGRAGRRGCRARALRPLGSE